MKRYTNFDSGWPVVIVFSLMAAFILGITPTGRQLCAEVLTSSTWARRVEPSAPARPQVLLVTSNRDDQFTVAVALSPRGYRVRVAETAATGQDILQSDASRIGMVVVDTELVQSGRVVSLARSLAPLAKLIQLRPNHGATDVSALLMAAI